MCACVIFLYEESSWFCRLGSEPKDDQTNRLQFLREFPWYANESCDQIFYKNVKCWFNIEGTETLKDRKSMASYFVSDIRVLRKCE
ncbi:hypothetical protein NECAME_17922 [Necator americanus]|uniref:Uncharacterized protein n=1 Tax=Necator americanus TaxID=51031 RepID=W2THK2_NECAM|nr:hypothetical protein NECAME_17922 [Necator americanus]ETN81273.1 hypothetical protein NECAME_17922 [Necator americanus]